MRVFEKHLPGGDRHHRRGCRFDLAKPVWLARNHFGGANRVLGIRPTKLRVRDAVNRIAFLELGDSLPGRFHHSR